MRSNEFVFSSPSASGGSSISQRKEVKTMTYSKPEIVVLGEANDVIQGSKAVPHEPSGVPIGRPFELDE